jgi:predicted RNA-binding protein with PUA-like domain
MPKRKKATRRTAPLKKRRPVTPNPRAVKPKSRAAKAVAPWKLPAMAPRRPGELRYWLLKTEPDVFSFSDLQRAPGATTVWDGVRNYQARNYLRDQIKPGDGVLIYHSGGAAPAIAGIASVTREGFPDPTQFDPKDIHFDAHSAPEAPTWFSVGVTAVRPLPRVLALDELRHTRGLERMILLQKGSRLSVQPVSAAEWDVIVRAV